MPSSAGPSMNILCGHVNSKKSIQSVQLSVLLSICSRMTRSL